MKSEIRLERARATLDWADEALNEFESASRAFFVDSSPFSVSVYYDDNSLLEVAILSLDVPFPDIFARKATEALNNIKHGCDQAIFAACEAIGTTGFKDNFPWARNPDDLGRLLVNRNIPEPIWGPIKRLEPYPSGGTYEGGHDGLRKLAKLANTKHTVGIALYALAGSVSVSKMNLTGYGTIMHNPGNEDLTKNNMLVMAASKGMDLSGEYLINSTIVFDDKTSLRGESVLGALSYFQGKVNVLIFELEAKCSEYLSTPS